MLLHEGRRPPPFDRQDFIYEVKHDGYRLVAGVDDGAVHLATRNGAPAAKWFPEIVRGLAQLEGGPHILDGEVVVQDEIGRSHFDRLQARARRRRWYEGCDPVVFCVFDALAVGGRSVVGQPIEQRKQLLRELLTPAPPGVLFVEHFDAQHGAELFEMARRLGLEGLVAKRLGSIYTPGERSPDWVKVKVPGAVPPQRFSRARARS